MSWRVKNLELDVLQRVAERRRRAAARQTKVPELSRASTRVSEFVLDQVI
jgi:hypothetical protein